MYGHNFEMGGIVDMSQVLDPYSIFNKDKCKWLKSFMDWRIEFFLSKMHFSKSEENKFKNLVLDKQHDIENNLPQILDIEYREDLLWFVNSMSYPFTQSIQDEQRFTVRNIYLYNEHNKKVYFLFLEIEEYNSPFKDFFLNIENAAITGKTCPICNQNNCTVQVVIYPDNPKKPFLKASCNNSQCKEHGNIINEIDYWKELEKSFLKRRYGKIAVKI